jgi:hypothetical protein
MLGVPGSPGAVGTALLVLGLALAAVGFLLARRRGLVPFELAGRVSAAMLALTLGVGPFVTWRIVEDLRVTTALDSYERRESGPIQAFLQPYLLDGVHELIPPGATYATAVSDAVPYEPARAAFPALALRELFPRRTVSDPARAEWIVAWGIDPRRLAPVEDVVVATKKSGVYPAVYVAKVRS